MDTTTATIDPAKDCSALASAFAQRCGCGTEPMRLPRNALAARSHPGLAPMTHHAMASDASDRQRLSPAHAIPLLRFLRSPWTPHASTYPLQGDAEPDFCLGMSRKLIPQRDKRWIVCRNLAQPASSPLPYTGASLCKRDPDRAGHLLDRCRAFEEIVNAVDHVGNQRRLLRIAKVDDGTFLFVLSTESKHRYLNHIHQGNQTAPRNGARMNVEMTSHLPEPTVQRSRGLRHASTSMALRHGADAAAHCRSHQHRAAD